MSIIGNVLKETGMSDEELMKLNEPENNLKELDSTSGYQIGSDSTGNPNGVEITPA